MGKRVSLYKFTVDAVKGLTLTANGQTRSITAADAMKLPTINAIVYNGLKQKAADVGASVKDPVKKAAAIMANMERICDGGAWNVGREPTGPTFDQEVLARAVVEAQLVDKATGEPYTDESIMEKVMKMPAAMVAKLRNSPELKEYADAIAEEMVADIDVSGCL